MSRSEEWLFGQAIPKDIAQVNPIRMSYPTSAWISWMWDDTTRQIKNMAFAIVGFFFILIFFDFIMTKSLSFFQKVRIWHKNMNLKLFSVYPLLPSTKLCPVQRLTPKGKLSDKSSMYWIVTNWRGLTAPESSVKGGVISTASSWCCCLKGEFSTENAKFWAFELF